jgi:hypothetical protein
MLELLWSIGIFLVGMTAGRYSPVAENKFADLYQKLNESQDSEYLFHAKYIDAENRAETWKRRYENLLTNTSGNGISK